MPKEDLRVYEDGEHVPECSATMGVKSFPIEGPMKRERYRLGGMTVQEKAWRKQWIKDQILSENEPVKLPPVLLNPIRKFYRWPLDTLFKPLVPAFGYEKAAMFRWFTGKGIMVLLGVYATAYYFKYNKSDWERKGGWRIMETKDVVLPNDSRFPLLSDRSKPSDYASRGFKDSPI